MQEKNYFSNVHCVCELLLFVIDSLFSDENLVKCILNALVYSHGLQEGQIILKVMLTLNTQVLWGLKVVQFGGKIGEITRYLVPIFQIALIWKSW